MMRSPRKTDLFALCFFALSTPVMAQRPMASPVVIPLETNGVPLEVESLAGIRILSNGSVLFSDAKPASVRIREGARGTIRQLARNGAGPGEYRAAPHFIGFRHDSVAGYDASLRRWSVLTPTGAFARVLAAGPDAATFESHAAWVAPGAVVFNAVLDSTRAPSGAAVAAVVASMASPGVPVIVRQTSNGSLWAATDMSARTWMVFDASGRQRARIELPVPFRLAQANDTAAIGQTLDADDLPQLVQVPIRDIPAARPSGAQANAVNAASASAKADARTTLTLLLRSLIGRQEMAYADNGSYVTSLQALKLELPAERTLRIIDAGQRGWFGVASDRPSGVTCATAVGFTVIGWSEAQVYCSR